MKSRKFKSKVLGATAFMAWFLLMTQSVWGDVSALPPRPVPPPDGGLISLTVTSDTPTAPMWTNIEWEHPELGWVTVDGWRGNPTHAGTVVWYLDSELVGSETRFRWNVYAEEGGKRLERSDPFLMPVIPGQIVEVSIDLTD